LNKEGNDLLGLVGNMKSFLQDQKGKKEVDRDDDKFRN
jgi:hypothetical protein